MFKGFDIQPLSRLLATNLPAGAVKGQDFEKE
jgi:hypothetical protein